MGRALSFNLQSTRIKFVNTSRGRKKKNFKKNSFFVSTHQKNKEEEEKLKHNMK